MRLLRWFFDSLLHWNVAERLTLGSFAGVDVGDKARRSFSVNDPFGKIMRGIFEHGSTRCHAR
jgi:hypothetical protein